MSNDVEHALAAQLDDGRAKLAAAEAARDKWFARWQQQNQDHNVAVAHLATVTAQRDAMATALHDIELAARFHAEGANEPPFSALLRIEALAHAALAQPGPGGGREKA